MSHIIIYKKREPVCEESVEGGHWHEVVGGRTCGRRYSEAIAVIRNKYMKYSLRRQGQTD